MASCLDFAGLGVVAVGTVAGFDSCFGAGGGYGYVPVAVCVAQGIDIRVGVGVTAGAGVGGEALGGAGGGRDGRLILVAKSRYLAGFGVVAVGAIALLGSCFGAGGFYRHVPVAVGVTQSINVAVGVGVTAVAGMGGEALGGTGGGRDDRVILVASCLDLTGLGVVAVGAIALLGSLFGASGGYSYVPVAVGVIQSIDEGVDVGVAAGAGMGGEALLGAGGSRDNGLILVT